MREVLFRGKRAINITGKENDGEMVIGNLVYSIGRHPMIEVWGATRSGDRSYAVIPKTVGQFTGTHDINGVKIFEGDIVEFYTSLNYSKIVKCGDDFKVKEVIKPIWKDVEKRQNAFGDGYRYVRKDQAIVQWNSAQGMWDLKVYNNGKYKRKSKLFTYRSEGGYTVIGNEHNNPELYKGEGAL